VGEEKIPLPTIQLGVRFVVLHTELLSPRELVRWQQLPLHSGLVKAAAIDQFIIFGLESTPAREFMNNNARRNW
jgi:hypothetical protein